MTDIHIIGGTGTRQGMTAPQAFTFVERLNLLKDAIEWHHGDCVGFDKQSHDITRDRAFWIVSHPPIMDRYRAFCKADLEYKPKSYLDRDRELVMAVQYLLACPAQETEQKRGSGTWATIRYAREYRVPHEIIYPDGKVEIFPNRR